MAYLPTTEDLALVQQKDKTQYVRIEILNRDFTVLEELQGETTSFDISIDGDSMLRRTLQCTLFLKDKTYLPTHFSKIWIDKLLRVYTGIHNNRTKAIKWYKQGVFVLDAPSYIYDATTSQLSLNCGDMMLLLDGTRGGKLGKGLSIEIPAGSNIRDVIIANLKQHSMITRYKVSPGDVDRDVTPIDYEFESGTTVAEILETLRDIYPCWEMFFDVDGTFVFQKVPFRNEDIAVLGGDFVKGLLVSEQVSYNFSEIYNVSDVYGASLEADRFSDTVAGTSSAITASYDGMTELENNVTYGFVAISDNLSPTTLKINTYETLPIKVLVNNSDGTVGSEDIKDKAILADRAYVVEYDEGDACFYFKGDLSIRAIVKQVKETPTTEEKERDYVRENTRNIAYDVNPDSPFAITKLFNDEGLSDGEIRNVYQGGEFDDISTEQLAMERASYETWKSTRLVDAYDLTLIDIPWLDANEKIQSYSMLSGEISDCLVLSISRTPLQGTMNMSLVKFFPYYPFTSDDLAPRPVP